MIRAIHLTCPVSGQHLRSEYQDDYSLTPGVAVYEHQTPAGLLAHGAPVSQAPGVSTLSTPLEPSKAGVEEGIEPKCQQA